MTAQEFRITPEHAMVVPVETVARRLMSMGAPKVGALFATLQAKETTHCHGTEAFVAIVLLTSWLGPEHFLNEVEVAEVFAGRARIARIAELSGYKSKAIDVLYDKVGLEADNSSMDMTKSAGLAFLGMEYRLKELLRGTIEVNVAAVLAKALGAFDPFGVCQNGGASSMRMLKLCEHKPRVKQKIGISTLWGSSKQGGNKRQLPC